MYLWFALKALSMLGLPVLSVFIYIYIHWHISFIFVTTLYKIQMNYVHIHVNVFLTAVGKEIRYDQKTKQMYAMTKFLFSAGMTFGVSLWVNFKLKNTHMYIYICTLFHIFTCMCTDTHIHKNIYSWIYICICIIFMHPEMQKCPHFAVFCFGDNFYF